MTVDRVAVIKGERYCLVAGVKSKQAGLYLLTYRPLDLSRCLRGSEDEELEISLTYLFVYLPTYPPTRPKPSPLRPPSLSCCLGTLAAYILRIRARALGDWRVALDWNGIRSLPQARDSSLTAASAPTGELPLGEFEEVVFEDECAKGDS